MKVTKASIEKIVSENGGSEQQVQIATARYDQCKSDEERAALYRELEGKFSARKESAQNKAVTTGDESGDNPKVLRTDRVGLVPSASGGSENGEGSSSETGAENEGGEGSEA